MLQQFGEKINDPKRAWQEMRTDTEWGKKQGLHVPAGVDQLYTQFDGDDFTSVFSTVKETLYENVIDSQIIQLSMPSIQKQ